MARIIICSFFPFLFAAAICAAVLQQPLPTVGFGRPYSDDAALNRLRASVGDRLGENVVPLGISCYSTSLPREPQCDYNTRLRTNDTWTADQAGGYFYVGLP